MEIHSRAYWTDWSCPCRCIWGDAERRQPWCPSARFPPLPVWTPSCHRRAEPWKGCPIVWCWDVSEFEATQSQILPEILRSSSQNDFVHGEFLVLHQQSDIAVVLLEEQSSDVFWEVADMLNIPSRKRLRMQLAMVTHLDGLSWRGRSISGSLYWWKKFDSRVSIGSTCHLPSLILRDKDDLSPSGQICQSFPATRDHDDIFKYPERKYMYMMSTGSQNLAKQLTLISIYGAWADFTSSMLTHECIIETNEWRGLLKLIADQHSKFMTSLSTLISHSACQFTHWQSDWLNYRHKWSDNSIWSIIDWLHDNSEWFRAKNSENVH